MSICSLDSLVKFTWIEEFTMYKWLKSLYRVFRKFEDFTVLLITSEIMTTEP